MMVVHDHVRYRPQFKRDPLLLTASGDYCAAMELCHDRDNHFKIQYLINMTSLLQSHRWQGSLPLGGCDSAHPCAARGYRDLTVEVNVYYLSQCNP